MEICVTYRQIYQDPECLQFQEVTHFIIIGLKVEDFAQKAHNKSLLNGFLSYNTRASISLCEEEVPDSGNES